MPVTKIESRDNPRLKHARKVRDGHELEQIYVEGLRLAEEAIRSDLLVEACFYAASFGDTDRKRDLVAAVSWRSSEVFEIPDKLFSSIADTKSAQGIVMLCRRPKADRNAFEKSFSLEKHAVPLVVMLTEVNNPSNLGAVIRTAEAAGAAGLIVSRNSADAFSPKALRAAMGSAFRLPIWEEADVDEAFEWARSAGCRTIAASGDGEVEYTTVDWLRPSLLIFGSEAHGVDQNAISKTDITVRIPMSKSVESLNLAVSAGVVLFEARRQNAAKIG